MPTALTPAGAVALPIDALLPEIVASLARHPSLVLVAAPGAGKTTRVPPALLAAGLAGERRVVMLEPRRVAARVAARRIAAEQGWEAGREVGWQVRFERRWSAETRLLVATEGVLATMLARDPFLESVGILILDEFHERHLDGDLALAMARHLQTQVRPDLRLVVMSATLDPAPLQRFLGDAPLVAADERRHRVEVVHADRADPRPIAARVAGAIRRELGQASDDPGDVLAFLPGKGEIEATGRLLAEAAAAAGVDVLPLHGELAAEAQDRALQRGPRRRIVLATNVAETSVTVEGVAVVVDSGLARVPRFDPGRGIDRLELVRIARASADQRAGRAGRERDGRCIRLWTAAEEHGLLAATPPEVRRVDLAPAVLTLASWGERAATFPWFDPPEPGAVAAAERLLARLGALDDAGTITALGRELAALPLHPRLGRVLLEGARLGHADAAATVAAALGAGLRTSGGRDDRPDREVGAVDLFLRLADPASLPRELPTARRQLLGLLDRRQDGMSDERVSREEALARALLAGFPDRLARRSGNRAVLPGGGAVAVPAGAFPGADLLVALDLGGGGSGGRQRDPQLRLGIAVDRSWLPEDRLGRRVDVEFDAERGRPIATVRTLWEDVTIEERPAPVPPEDGARLLAAAAIAAGLPPRDDTEVASLLARLRNLVAWMPELALPELDEAAIAEVVTAAAAGSRDLDAMRRVPWAERLADALPHSTRAALDRHAPERLAVPSGSRIRLLYEPGRPPVLAARIQELFGLAETPRVAAGRVPVLVHLLAPSGRPQQVTQDLRSFWDNTYPEVRRELQRRYPRHAWPDDPWNARAERRPAPRR